MEITALRGLFYGRNYDQVQEKSMSLKDDEAKLAEWIKTGNDAADAKVDSFLDKVKASDWTPAIIALGGALIFVALILAWLIG